VSAPVGRVELRSRRLATVVVGVAAIVAATGLAVVASRSNDVIPGAAFLAFLAVIVLLPFAVGVLAPWIPDRWLRWLNAAILVEYAALLVLLVVGAALGWLPGGEVPWFFTTPAVPAAAAMLAWGRRAAWGTVAASVVAVVCSRVLAEHDPVRLAAHDTLSFVAAALLVLLFDALLVAARRLDEATALAVAAAGQEAAGEARAQAAEQFAALTHDELLATLLAAREDRPDLRRAVAQRARRSRRLLRELHDEESAGPVALPELLVALRAEAAAAVPTAAVDIEGSRRALDAAPELPAEAAAAILGAATQALANATRHAGAERISVVVAPLPDGVRIAVRDDGRGFDPAAVPPGRMGIATSILARVRAVAGGGAEIVSAPGEGTRVSIEWRRDGAGGPVTTPVPAAPGPSRPTGVFAADSPAIRRFLRIGIVVLLAAFAALAALAGLRTDLPIVHAAAWLGIAAGFAAIGWSTLARPSQLRGLVVLLIATGVAALSWIPIERDPATWGDAWYIPAMTPMLAGLAARGRSGVAALAGGLVAAVVAGGGIVHQNDTIDLVAAAVRLCGGLSVGLLLIGGTVWIRRRTVVAQALQVEQARAASARAAGRRELRERSAGVEALIGRTLDRLAGDEPLSDADRAECAALEGRLRDQYRAGRLAGEPLVAAAMRARRRGVDVVLLDDPDRVLAADEVEAARRWIAARLDAVDEGVFTGRILPSVYAALASAVTEDEAAQLDPGARVG